MVDIQRPEVPKYRKHKMYTVFSHMFSKDGSDLYITGTEFRATYQCFIIKVSFNKCCPVHNSVGRLYISKPSMVFQHDQTTSDKDGICLERLSGPLNFA